MPYLCYDEYSEIEIRRETYDSFSNQEQFFSISRSQTLAPANMCSVQFLLTLDEFCAPALDQDILADRHKIKS